MTAGAVRFCRYAYAPNALGYCGPDEAPALLELGAKGEAGPELERLARGFEGAWPYLTLIAHANGIADPLDQRVVEAYWVGNPLLRRVGPTALGRFMEERFKPRVGRRFGALAELPAGPGVPHHNLHVLVIYPWVGLLRHGRPAEPLRVLDRCRVRWGTVEQVGDGTVSVRSRPLEYDGCALALGEPRLETAVLSVDGLGFATGVRPGDRVSLHWDWVCERLDARGVRALQRSTALALAAANEVLRRPEGSLLA
jgi:hypothetical protein